MLSTAGCALHRMLQSSLCDSESNNNMFVGTAECMQTYAHMPDIICKYRLFLCTSSGTCAVLFFGNAATRKSLPCADWTENLPCWFKK
jgi:hypothetical protein